MLEWVDIAMRRRSRAGRASEGASSVALLRSSGLAYRSSRLVEGEIVDTRLLCAAAGGGRAGEGDNRRHARPAPRGPAPGDQDVRLDVQEPRRDRDAQDRTAGQLLSDAGCNGLAVGGARFALKHANFIENTGSATTADIVAVMAAGRRRVLERFGVALEPEAQTLGDVRFPWRSADQRLDGERAST